MDLNPPDQPARLLGAITLAESYDIVGALIVALQNNGFHVQARERDGLTEERMVVSYGGDHGAWLTITAEFKITKETT